MNVRCYDQSGCDSFRRLGYILGCLTLLAMLAAACRKQDQTKTVALTLRSAEGSMDVTIFPVVDNRIIVSTSSVLGAGKTDKDGRITIDFKTPAKYSEYVPLVSYSVNAGKLPFSNGGPIIFRCDKSPCDLGAFEVLGFGLVEDGTSIRESPVLRTQ